MRFGELRCSWSVKIDRPGRFCCQPNFIFNDRTPSFNCPGRELTDAGVWPCVNMAVYQGACKMHQFMPVLLDGVLTSPIDDLDTPVAIGFHPPDSIGAAKKRLLL